MPIHNDDPSEEQPALHLRCQAELREDGGNPWQDHKAAGMQELMVHVVP